MNKPDTFERILGLLPFGCVLMGEDQQVQFMNPTMAKVLGLPNEKVAIGFRLLDYFHDDDQESFVAFMKKPGKAPTEQTWEAFRLTNGDGYEIKVLMSGTHPTEDSGVDGDYLLVCVPFESVISEKADHDPSQKGRYENIFNSATVGITILDESGTIEESNQTFLDFFHNTKEAILGKHYSDFFQGEARVEFERSMQMLENAKSAYIKNVITLDPEKTERSILEISISWIKGDHPDHKKYMLITEDLTHQEDTHAALLQAEKLSLTGRLAASLAHEINNPLQTSIGCLGLAQEMLDSENQELGIYLEMAIEELRRSARIVKKLRDLNRKSEPLEKTPVNVQELLHGVLLLTKNQIFDHNIVPVFPYQGPPPIVLASKDQLQQVLLNLIMNAIDALPEGGNFYMDIIHTENPPGVSIKIRDTGAGISPEAMDHLFDPFFTTKADGIGLGLYICKNIIEDHQGTLKVESEPGNGTEFTVWLPGAGSQAEE